MSNDLHERRNGHNLDRYVHLQAVAMRKLFWREHHREATETEIGEWIGKQNWPAPPNPYDILTPDEIRAYDESCVDRRHGLECFAILKLFRVAHGRDAANAEEAEEWYKQNYTKPPNPFAVLTPDEFAEYDDLTK